MAKCMMALVRKYYAGHNTSVLDQCHETMMGFTIDLGKSVWECARIEVLRCG